jgi:hypothetical protein
MAQDPDHGVTTLLGHVDHAKVLEHEDGILNSHWIPPAMETPRKRMSQVLVGTDLKKLQTSS